MKMLRKLFKVLIITIIILSVLMIVSNAIESPTSVRINDPAPSVILGSLIYYGSIGLLCMAGVLFLIGFFRYISSKIKLALKEKSDVKDESQIQFLFEKARRRANQFWVLFIISLIFLIIGLILFIPAKVV